MTREGAYKLMTLSEYSRQNRVTYNGQGNTPVKVSFITLNDPSGTGDRICFNVGRELYFYMYKGVRKVRIIEKSLKSINECIQRWIVRLYFAWQRAVPKCWPWITSWQVSGTVRKWVLFWWEGFPRSTHHWPQHSTGSSLLTNAELFGVNHKDMTAFHLFYHLISHIALPGCTSRLPGRGRDKILSWYISMCQYKISGRQLEIRDAKIRVRLAGVMENAGLTCHKLSMIKRFFASRE